jgi:DNA-binding transcriptional ArsR family regulator
VVRTSLPQQIKASLAGGALTIEELAGRIEGASSSSVAAKLRWLKGKGLVLRLDNDEQGRGRWGLPA